MAAVDGGLLDWWLEGGKQFVDVDLDSDAGVATYRRLAASADLVIDTTAPGRLAELGVDHADLVGANPRLVQVSLTPFGRTGPRAEWQTSDLVAGAMSGILSLSGTADHAIGAWGRQNLTFGSLMACICGLAGVHAARETGQGALVDLSLQEVLTGSIENLFFQWWFPDLLPIPQRALRQGSLHWFGAYVVADCKTGACNIAPVPHPTPLFEWMAEEGDPDGEELSKLSIEEALADIPRVMHALRRFARTKDSGELFHEAQRRHIAFGEVQTVAQVAKNPQYEFRGTFRSVDGVDGVRMPGPFARFNGTPSPAAAAAAGDGRRRGRAARLVGRCSGVAADACLAAPRRTDVGGQAARRVAHRRLHLGARRPALHPDPRRPRCRRPQVPVVGAGHAGQPARVPLLLRVEPLEATRLARHEAARGARPHPPDHRTVRRADGELLRRRARPLGHRLRAGQGVEPGDRLRDDERTGTPGAVVEGDHVRADDPRAVRADLPLQPGGPARRRPGLLPQRPCRRAVRHGRRAGGDRSAAAHRRGSAHRHRPDGDGDVPHRSGRARLPVQRPGGPPERQRRPVRRVVPERGVPLRRPARGGDHLPGRRRLAAAVRGGQLGHRRSRRGPVTGHGGGPVRPVCRDRRAPGPVVHDTPRRRGRGRLAGQRRAGRHRCRTAAT